MIRGLALCIACQEEHLILSSEALEVSIVPSEQFKDLVGQLGVEAETTDICLLSTRLRKILIIEVVETTIFLLRHIPQPMEPLNVTAINENKDENLPLIYLHFVHMFEDRVRHNNVCENITIFNEINLVKCKVVINDENLVNLLVDYVIIIKRVVR